MKREKIKIYNKWWIKIKTATNDIINIDFNADYSTVQDSIIKKVGKLEKKIKSLASGKHQAREIIKNEIYILKQVFRKSTYFYTGIIFRMFISFAFKMDILFYNMIDDCSSSNYNRNILVIDSLRMCIKNIPRDFITIICLYSNVANTNLNNILTGIKYIQFHNETHVPLYNTSDVFREELYLLENWLVLFHNIMETIAKKNYLFQIICFKAKLAELLTFCDKIHTEIIPSKDITDFFDDIIKKLDVLRQQTKIFSKNLTFYECELVKYGVNSEFTNIQDKYIIMGGQNQFNRLRTQDNHFILNSECLYNSKILHLNLKKLFNSKDNTLISSIKFLIKNSQMEYKKPNIIGYNLKNSLYKVMNKYSLDNIACQSINFTDKGEFNNLQSSSVTNKFVNLKAEIYISTRLSYTEILNIILHQLSIIYNTINILKKDKTLIRVSKLGKVQYIMNIFVIPLLSFFEFYTIENLESSFIQNFTPLMYGVTFIQDITCKNPDIQAINRINLRLETYYDITDNDRISIITESHASNNIIDEKLTPDLQIEIKNLQEQIKNHGNWLTKMKGFLNKLDYLVTNKVEKKVSNQIEFIIETVKCELMCLNTIKISYMDNTEHYNFTCFFKNLNNLLINCDIYLAIHTIEIIYMTIFPTYKVLEAIRLYSIKAKILKECNYAIYIHWRILTIYEKNLRTYRNALDMLFYPLYSTFSNN